MTIDIAYKHTKCFGYNRDHMDNTLGLYIYSHMATEIWVNIGSGNGLLPDGTKPLSEPMLIYHQ